LVGNSSIYRESIISHVPPPKRHPYDQWSPDTRALDLVGDKWTLLIVRDLASGPRRFVELQRVLPGISTEQLRSRLNRMVADGMLTRMRYREVPPRVDYELTDRARELMPVLGALARWGYEWTWSEPRGSESVDIGAIFRLAPGVLSPSAPARKLEFAVTDAGAFYSIGIGPDRVEVAEGKVDAPDARARGSIAGWIAALSPAHNRDGLEISGDASLVASVLDSLGPHAEDRATTRDRAAA
jgi:DNA-binding HxlR family transcriptional regulator